jgi:hypothetical protein
VNPISHFENHLGPSRGKCLSTWRNDRRTAHFAVAARQAAANLRRFNYKAMGVGSQLIYHVRRMVLVLRRRYRESANALLLITKGQRQPTACGRMDRAFWNQILFAGNLVPGFREPIRPQSRGAMQQGSGW